MSFLNLTRRILLCCLVCIHGCCCYSCRLGGRVTWQAASSDLNNCNQSVIRMPLDTAVDLGLLLLLCRVIVARFGWVWLALHCFLQLSRFPASTVCWIAQCVGSWVLLGLFCLLRVTQL